MTGPDRYRHAEELLTGQGVLDYLHVGTAQVHATLALPPPRPAIPVDRQSRGQSLAQMTLA